MTVISLAPLHKLHGLFLKSPDLYTVLPLLYLMDMVFNAISPGCAVWASLLFLLSFHCKAKDMTYYKEKLSCLATLLGFRFSLKIQIPWGVYHQYLSFAPAKDY